jgi:hypothetical protein
MPNRSLSLEEQCNVAQSILSTPAAAEAERLEWALAAACGAVASAMQRDEPGSAAGLYETAAGMAIFAGAGSPLTSAARPNPARALADA